MVRAHTTCSLVFAYLLYPTVNGWIPKAPLHSHLQKLSRHDVLAAKHAKGHAAHASVSNRPFEFSLSASVQEETVSKTKCKFCDKDFESRNKLFRHIQTDPKCSIQGGMMAGALKWERQFIHIKFGYVKDDSTPLDPTSEQTEAKIAGNMVLESLTNLTRAKVDEIFQGREIPNNVELLSSSQTSVAKMRHLERVFAQEEGCSAAQDTIAASVNVPSIMNDETWLAIFDELEGALPHWIRLNMCEIRSSSFHAERGCTQRVYHYLLPLSWFPDDDANALVDWFKFAEPQDPTYATRTFQKISKPPDALRRFKTLLRRAECPTIEKRPKDGPSSTRFSSLAYRDPRPWHNFADPTLRGDASPSNQPVWCIVDRCRATDMLDCGDDVVLVVEIKGDEFLREQTRRIVGSAVAMMHGYLPEDFFEQATRADRFVGTPLAPPNRMYVAETKFHYDELYIHRNDTTWTKNDGKESIDWVQSRMLEEIQNNKDMLNAERGWVEELESSVCPRIRGQLAIYNEELPIQDIVDIESKSAPDEYHDVLHGLRTIVETNSWPDTSTARSSVIQNVTQNKGSFTVVNPLHEHIDPSSSMPMGNDLFPELTRAIFDLESELSKGWVQNIAVDNGDGEMATVSSTTKTSRPSSSHCAVNCCAQFTPHVDSGVGVGQSLSMIVGLGDYSGGELFVEGDPVEIRYKPTQFDGWKLRHWTNRFQGERFSLVWFTPEKKGAK